MLTSEDLVEDLKEERDRLIQTVKYLEQQLDLRDQKIKNLEHEIELCMIQVNIAMNEQYKKQKDENNQAETIHSDVVQTEAAPADIAHLEKLLEESLGFYVQLQTTTSDLTKALLFEAIQQNDRIVRKELQLPAVGPDSKQICSLLQKANVILQCSKKVSGLK